MLMTKLELIKELIDLVRFAIEILKEVSILIKSMHYTENLFLFSNLNLPCYVKFSWINLLDLSSLKFDFYD